MIAPLHASLHRILVVEDDRPVREAVSRYLRAYGYAVDTAGGPEEAGALLAAGWYSLVIAAQHLTGPAGREGLDLVGLARRHRGGIRVIVLTPRSASDHDRERSRDGADALVETPLLLSDLRFEVDRLVDWRRSAPIPQPLDT